MMNSLPSQKIKKLGLKLPPAPKPAGLYNPLVISGNLLYISGQGPIKDDGTQMVGKVGRDISAEEGKLAARQVGLTMISTILEHFNDIDRIKRVVKVLGMVNCSMEFIFPAFGTNSSIQGCNFETSIFKLSSTFFVPENFASSKAFITKIFRRQL